MPLRVSLLTGCSILGEGFRTVVSREPDLELVSIFSSFEKFIAEIERVPADILLVDGRPDMTDGQLWEIARRSEPAKLILWLQTVPVALARIARELGVRGILRKDSPGDLTLRCIRKVGEGQLWFDRELLDALLDFKAVRLSPREKQLLELVTHGLGNKQIAAELGISEGTVKVYFSKLFRKVGVRDRFELALYGLEHRNLMSEFAGRPFSPRIGLDREQPVARPLSADVRR